MSHTVFIFLNSMSRSQSEIRGQITSLQLLGKVQKQILLMFTNIRHHDRVCHAQDTGFHTQGQGHRGQRSSCLNMSL